MGNVNAREEANSNNASAVEDEDAEICSREAMSAASDGNHVAPPELMGQSPPHSPRATQSPLMFAPQVFVLVSDSMS
jgi:5'-AMP-activated protein kinase regulatory beta subunit